MGKQNLLFAGASGDIEFQHKGQGTGQRRKTERIEEGEIEEVGVDAGVEEGEAVRQEGRVGEEEDFDFLK